MIALISTVFGAIKAYLELKLVRAKWDLMKDIEEYHLKIDEEIDKLRRQNTTESNLRADRLRDSLLRMQGIAASIKSNLSTTSPDSSGQNTNPNG